MTDWLRICAVGVSLLVLAACDSSSEEAEGAGTGGASAEEGPTKLRTEDGYEVVLADPSRRTGPTPSKQGDVAEARRRERLILEPNAPDPEGGEFTLEEAVEGMPVDGQLVAEMGTDLGTMFCDLYADRVPETVAAFIGLTRGIRPWWDPEAGQWVERPYYMGTSFHRVIPEYLVQAGDRLGDGTGGIGFDLPQESHEALRFDRAGVLAMVNGQGDDDATAGQIFITDSAQNIDGNHNIFGRCIPESVVHRIARVPQGGGPDHNPLTPVRINRVFIKRVPGGAENATITAPQPPPSAQAEEGEEEHEGPRGASPGPSQLRNQIEERRRLREQQHGH